MTSEVDGEPVGTAPVEEDWQRLSPRSALPSGIIVLALCLGLALVLGIVLGLAGVAVGWIAFWLVGGTVLLTGSLVLGESLRVAATRYQVGPERVEMRVQLFASSRTSVARDRIRHVELTSDLVQRRFGIADLRLGTGEKDAGGITLSSLPRAEAERLRDALGRGLATGAATLATFDRGWIRYAPVSVLTPALGAAAVGAVFQVADWFGAVPWLVGWLAGVAEQLTWLGVVGVVVLLVLVIGTVASLAIFVDGWWRLVLTRDESGTVRVNRGLLIQRSSTFEGRRLRGVVLVEPLGVRRLGAARVDAVAVGLDTTDQDGQAQSSTVLPPAPRLLAVQVAERVLGASLPMQLVPHPPAARRRRLVRAGVAAVLLLAGVGGLLVLLPRPWWVLVLAALVLAVGVLGAFAVALDGARGLGHQIGDAHVTLRSGSLVRRTVVLQRQGLLGWTVRQSPLQRRAGLVTLVATSAAGQRAFRLPDVGVEQAGALLATAGPVWPRYSAVPAAAS